MNKFILLVFVFITLNTQAQFKELNCTMSKGSQNGFLIPLDSCDQSIAFDVLTKTIADKDPKANASIISFGELYFDNVLLPAISDKAIDIYARFNALDTTLILFAELGTGFVKSTINSRESMGMNQLGMDLKLKLKQFQKQIKIDTLKKHIKLKEAQLERVIDDLKSAENFIKNNTSGANKDDKQVAKTESKLQENKRLIAETDTLIVRKQKEFNAFPLMQIKSENEIKNKTLSDNRKSFKKLAKANAKSEETILQCEVDLELNKTKLTLAGEDKKALKKALKEKEKLNSKIADERLNITNNKAKQAVLTGLINDDSIFVKANEAKLIGFDEAGRLKEIKQLQRKKENLIGKTEKQSGKIADNKQEAEQKRKEAEDAAKQVETLKVLKTQLQLELKQMQEKLLIMQQ